MESVPTMHSPTNKRVRRVLSVLHVFLQSFNLDKVTWGSRVRLLPSNLFGAYTEVPDGKDEPELIVRRWLMAKTAGTLYIAWWGIAIMFAQRHQAA